MLPEVLTTNQLSLVISQAAAPAFLLEPIQEVLIQRQRFDLVKRRSIMRIMARRMKAATVLA